MKMINLNILLSLYLIFVGLFLTSCNSYYYDPDFHGKISHTVPYVSAYSGDEGAYISAGKERYREYVSDANKPYVDAFTEAKMEIATEQEIHQIGEASHDPLVGSITSDTLVPLWGSPPGSQGDGVTLLNIKLRKRLNDALETTPLSGEARWIEGSSHYIFRPNSKIYQPYHSGGKCRDGLFTTYNSYQEKSTRGLFCKQGQGADWLLVR